MQQPALPSDQIRVQQGVYLFSALGGGVLHGAAAADHQLQVLQGPQILQRVFARHRVTMKSALLPGAIKPVTSPMPASCALRRVAVWRAKRLLMPPSSSGLA